MPSTGIINDQQAVPLTPAKPKVKPLVTTPRSLTEARGFVALTSYYRWFVCSFAEIALPIQFLTQGVWEDSQREAFADLKHCLVTAPVLSLPRDECRYVLDSDVSDKAQDLVLQQEQDGMLKLIAYASRALQPADRSYCTTRRELSAVIYGWKHL